MIALRRAPGGTRGPRPDHETRADRTSRGDTATRSSSQTGPTTARDGARCVSTSSCSSSSTLRREHLRTRAQRGIARARRQAPEVLQEVAKGWNGAEQREPTRSHRSSRPSGPSSSTASGAFNPRTSRSAASRLPCVRRHAIWVPLKERARGTLSSLPRWSHACRRRESRAAASPASAEDDTRTGRRRSLRCAQRFAPLRQCAAKRHHLLFAGLPHELVAAVAYPAHRDEKMSWNANF